MKAASLYGRTLAAPELDEPELGEGDEGMSFEEIADRNARDLADLQADAYYGSRA